MRELDGRVAVVTGAGSGIGRSLAGRFTVEGMHVVLADVEEAALRAEVLAVPTDVTSRESVARLAERAFGRFGAVHVLCNNAGIAVAGSLVGADPADWQRAMAINFWGVVHGLDAFLPRMLAEGRGGHVVNTASMAGLLTPPLGGPYSVTKHGVVALSEALAQDLALRRARIGVSVLCPGFVATRLADSAPGADALVRALVGGGRPAEEIADRTVRAIRQGEFYVLTHPGMAPAIRRRAARIAAGTAPAPLSLRRSRAGSR